MASTYLELTSVGITFPTDKGPFRALQQVDLPEGALRGHTYHHSVLDCALAPLARGVCPNGKPVAEAVYRLGRLTASYIHFYLPSNPRAAAELLLP